jgi:hypothetical protein
MEGQPSRLPSPFFIKENKNRQGCTFSPTKEKYSKK